MMRHDKSAVHKILDQAKAAKREALTAPEARGVCEAYGITIPKEGLAKTAEEAAKLASDIGFPVVMKIVSPQILHKTEAGGVITFRLTPATKDVPGDIEVVAEMRAKGTEIAVAVLGAKYRWARGAGLIPDP